MKGQKALMSRAATGGKDDWQTPDEVLELVRAVAPIGLDPCTTEENPTGAEYWVIAADDGLTRTWYDRGLVYVNPPFSQSSRWVDKAIQVAGLTETEIILLLPARTDTKAFHRLADAADAICFWAGRMKFKGAPAHAPFPSMLVYLGERATRFARVFGAAGWVVRP